MMKTRPFAWSVLTVAALLALPSHAQNNPYADGNAAAPDEWLLVKKGNSLKALYGDEIPTRGQVQVGLRDPLEAGTTGVVASVLGLLTGAAAGGGFAGISGQRPASTTACLGQRTRRKSVKCRGLNQMSIRIQTLN